MSHTQEMQILQTHARPLRPGLRLEPLESSGHPVSDEETNAIIRQILIETQPPRSGRAALPDIAAQDEFAEMRRAPTPRQVRADLRAEAEAEAGVRPDPVLYPEAAEAPRGRSRLPRRLALFGALALFVYMWPWAIPLALFVSIWVAVIVCATVGSDWIGQGAGRAYRWLDRRNPERAERLRARADAAALRLDGLLDRLPERWTAGLYLPDFSRATLMPESQPERPDPFDRIAVEARGI